MAASVSAGISAAEIPPHVAAAAELPKQLDGASKEKAALSLPEQPRSDGDSSGQPASETEQPKPAAETEQPKQAPQTPASASSTASDVSVVAASDCCKAKPTTKLTGKYSAPFNKQFSLYPHPAFPKADAMDVQRFVAFTNKVCSGLMRGVFALDVFLFGFHMISAGHWHTRASVICGGHS